MLRWMTFLLAAIACTGAAAADYLLTATRPNRLHMVDLATRQVSRSFDIPGDGIPVSISVAKDGKVAYVLTNRFESVVGIDLDTGKQVFRADFSDRDTRVKAMFAMTVSDDGKRLYVHQSPVKLKRYEYEVLDTRIAVYDTAAGLAAKPLRSFPAPRRISLLMPGAGPDRIAALGWDIYILDAESGAVKKTLPLRNWQRPGVGEPDILTIWPHFEMSRSFSAPYYVPMTEADPQSPESFKTGILAYDLDSETLRQAEFENATRGFFSSVMSPANKNEAYAVMNQLTHIDLEGKRVIGSEPLEQTYYAINASADGKEIYLGGALDKIAVHDAQTLKRIAEIRLPEGSDQSLASMRIVRRP